jgi:hypothetical protein
MADIASLLDHFEQRQADVRARLSAARAELQLLDAHIAGILAETTEPRRDARIFCIRVGVVLRRVAAAIDGAAA